MPAGTGGLMTVRLGLGPADAVSGVADRPRRTELTVTSSPAAAASESGSECRGGPGQACAGITAVNNLKASVSGGVSRRQSAAKPGLSAESAVQAAVGKCRNPVAVS